MEKSVSLIDLYNELRKIEEKMVTKEEFNMGVKTLSVLSNEDTMRQLQESEEDIKTGRIKKITSVRDL